MNILVVDDEALIVQMLQTALTEDGVTVTGVADSEAALTFFKNNSVDLVISDIMMPKMRGTKLFHEMRKVDPFVQVILITGYPSLQDIVEMLECGAVDFIIKPFRIDDLKRIVNENIARIKRWRELRSIWVDVRKKGSE